MDVTAYTAGFESTGKHPGDSEYGITYSGERAKQGVTVAMGRKYAIGTKVYIPYFRDWPNQGVFIVQDRGSAVGDKNVDVYFDDVQEARAFGRRELMVFILGGGGDEQ